MLNKWGTEPTPWGRRIKLSPLQMSKRRFGDIWRLGFWVKCDTKTLALSNESAPIKRARYQQDNP